jgi:preprotein translocase subunit YajC
VGYLIVLVALFALMWLLLIRPQRQRQNSQIRMQDQIRAGDEIITAGGLHGTIKAIEDDIVFVEIAPGTTVRVDRRAVAGVASAEEPEEEEEEEPKPPQTEHPAPPAES